MSDPLTRSLILKLCAIAHTMCTSKYGMSSSKCNSVQFVINKLFKLQLKMFSKFPYVGNFSKKMIY